MTSSAEESSDLRTRLHLVWWEMPRGDEPGSWWGQVAGGANRVRLLAEGLERAARRRDVSRGLTELAYHLENYFVRIYELRERAIPLAESITGAKLGPARNPTKRERTLALISNQFADIREHLAKLLQLLDEDIVVRNEHTHSQFLSLQLVIPPSHVYDPDDVLRETANRPENARIRRVLRHGIMRLSYEHAEKAIVISSHTWELLEAAHRHILGATA